MNVEIMRVLLLPTKVMTVVGTMTMMRLLMMLTMMMMFFDPMHVHLHHRNPFRSISVVLCMRFVSYTSILRRVSSICSLSR